MRHAPSPTSRQSTPAQTSSKEGARRRRDLLTGVQFFVLMAVLAQVLTYLHTAWL